LKNRQAAGPPKSFGDPAFHQGYVPAADSWRLMHRLQAKKTEQQGKAEYDKKYAAAEPFWHDPLAIGEK